MKRTKLGLILEAGLKETLAHERGEKKLRATMKKQVPYVSDEEEQVKAFRKNPKLTTVYLNACIETAFKVNEPELVPIALATVAKSFSLNGESVRRMFSKRGKAEWNLLFRVFKALHLRLKLEKIRRPVAGAGR